MGFQDGRRDRGVGYMDELADDVMPLVPVHERRFWPISGEREIAALLIYSSKLRCSQFPFARPRLKIGVSGQELLACVCDSRIKLKRACYESYID